MSSLRNAVKRITHKERAQPQHRKHLGHLEKKVDYKVRARDYHRKEDRINAMRASAAMRNPDEFYFGMHSAEVRGGAHRKTQRAKQKEFEAAVGLDTVRVMKDQDLSYIRMQKQKDAKQMEKIRSSLHLLHEGGPGTGEARSGPKGGARRHTVFVESREEADQFSVADHFDTLPELASRAFNRPRLSQLAKQSAVKEEEGENPMDRTELAIPPTKRELDRQAREARKAAKKIARAQAAAYRELEARSQRVGAMELAEAHLVTEKLVASKGRKRKIREAEDGKPAQYKWRRKRLG
jgi:U3 small nucleolar RNA-associated protein 11